MFAACLQIAAIPLIALVDPTELRRTLPRPEGARSKLGKAALLGLGGFLVAMTVRAVAKGF